MASRESKAMKVLMRARANGVFESQIGEAISIVLDALTTQEDDNHLLQKKIGDLQKQDGAQEETISALRREIESLRAEDEKPAAQLRTISYDGVCIMCGSKKSTIYRCTDDKYRIVCTNPLCKCFCRIAPTVGYNFLRDTHRPQDSTLFTESNMTMSQYYS